MNPTMRYHHKALIKRIPWSFFQASITQSPYFKLACKVLHDCVLLTSVISLCTTPYSLLSPLSLCPSLCPSLSFPTIIPGQTSDFPGDFNIPCLVTHVVPNSNILPTFLSWQLQYHSQVSASMSLKSPLILANIGFHVPPNAPLTPYVHNKPLNILSIYNLLEDSILCDRIPFCLTVYS